ncbi:lytic murein transglycosylase B [Undibacterium sp. LX40W]|uniref:Lytic murein transglycosylase B n=1 Tax=Undibacterium nitidum TaxID=2762298 RepID=A0A923HN44_9BURK|nr:MULTISPECIES: lytic murein transglycosylase B [Undibacterium]MBC3882102.1 lytic murein transglycosylase B [Undibacterium nitidum]MBC3892383.1 lytic murein transglycosylase B [Undibacterium sp. LX40W]
MNTLRILSKFVLIALLSLSSTEAYSSDSKHKKNKTIKRTPAVAIQGENVHFLDWKVVQEFRQEMLSKYQYDGVEFDNILKQTRFVESAVQLMKPMPAGKPKNWKVYRSRFVETARVNAGVAFWNRNETTLKKAETEFGVPAEIIVGLIGVETIYGKNIGRYNAIDAITTLAFAYPDTPNKEARTLFFKNELAQLLLWGRETKSDVLQIKASYAGAIGLCQFMPSSLRNFAVDYDQDGHIDLRTSEVDAIGSVANYLAKHGWKKDLPYVFPASIHQSSENPEQSKRQIDEFLGKGLRASLTLESLKPYVTTPDVNAPSNILYGVVDLQNGEDPTEFWLASENFFAITQYNRSYFYAMSVIDLGKVINLARTKD